MCILYAEAVKAMIECSGISIREFALKNGFTPGTLGMWIRNDRNPKFSNVERIAKALNCSVSDISNYRTVKKGEHEKNMRIEINISDSQYEELTALCEAMGTGTVSETIRTLIREKRESIARNSEFGAIHTKLDNIQLDIDTIRREFFAMKYEGKNPFKN